MRARLPWCDLLDAVGESLPLRYPLLDDVGARVPLPCYEALPDFGVRVALPCYEALPGVASLPLLWGEA